MKCLSLGVLLVMVLCSTLSTAADNTNLLRGQLVSGGVICALIKTDAGEILPLAGISHNKFPIGTQLELEGQRVTRSICQQGAVTFKVDKILSMNGELPVD